MKPGVVKSFPGTQLRIAPAASSATNTLPGATSDALPPQARHAPMAPARRALAAALALAALLPFGTAPAAQAPAGPRTIAVEGRVTRVLDGDSLLVVVAGNGTRGVRVAGIDAPEKGQPHADAARRALLGQLHERTVRVDVVKTDAFGRLVGRVFVDDRDVGLAQLRAGLAWHFTRYDADLAPAVRRRYARAERQAKLRGIGLWRDAAPVPPWEHRAAHRRGTALRPAPQPGG